MSKEDLHSSLWASISQLVEDSIEQKRQRKGQAQWLTPLIPALWEVKAGRSQGQEMQTTLVNMVKQKLAGRGGACL